MNLEKSSLTNWIFSLFRTEFLLPVKPAKINFEFDFCRLKIQLVEFDFSNLIFQNSSTDQEGDCVPCITYRFLFPLQFRSRPNIPFHFSCCSSDIIVFVFDDIGQQLNVAEKGGIEPLSFKQYITLHTSKYIPL